MNGFCIAVTSPLSGVGAVGKNAAVRVNLRGFEARNQVFGQVAAREGTRQNDAAQLFDFRSVCAVAKPQAVRDRLVSQSRGQFGRCSFDERIGVGEKAERVVHALRTEAQLGVGDRIRREHGPNRIGFGAGLVVIVGLSGAFCGAPN
jgi:hypothetical protein